MKPVKKLTLTALFSAICVGVLYLGSLVPTLQLVAAAAGALTCAATLIQCGPWFAAGSLLVSGGLSLLLLPDKTTALWFAVVFGPYMIVKSRIELLKSRLWLQWLLKVLYFLSVIALMYFAFQAVFLAPLPDESPLLLYGCLFAAFVLYDIACTRLIAFYDRRIRPHMK